MISLAIAASVTPALHAAPPDTFDLPEPTPTTAPTPEAEGPIDEGAPPPVPAEPADSPAAEPLDTEAEAENAAAGDPSVGSGVIASPVVQPLPGESDEMEADGGNALTPADTTTSAALAGPLDAPAPSVQTPPVSAAQTLDSAAATEAEGGSGADGDATSAIPGLSATVPEAAENAGNSSVPSPTVSTGETHQAVWWLLGVIGVALFGFVGWTYTRRRTAPIAVIEKPSIAGAAALNSIEDAKLALSLDILGATRSIMMLSVEFRLSVNNRSVRAIRNLAVIPQLDTAQRGNAADRGPAVAHGTGETLRIDRIGPHQSEVVTGTITLPVSAIRPILQGSKPLFVPLLHFQLQLDRLSPQTHSFVLGLPSAANAARLHPLALDDTPGGIPGLQTRKLEGQKR